MKIREWKMSPYDGELVELIAENIWETNLLRKLFNGAEDTRIQVISFGYDRKMPRVKNMKGERNLEWWAKRQTLVLRLPRIVTCPHCEGKGEVAVVMYPASGAEIEQHTCGICKGNKEVPYSVLEKYLNRNRYVR